MHPVNQVGVPEDDERSVGASVLFMSPVFEFWTMNFAAVD